MDCLEAAAICACICFQSAGGKLIIVKRLWDVVIRALYKCTTLLLLLTKEINKISINTQVTIQNRVLSLARYLGLSADNHRDGQNGCR